MNWQKGRKLTEEEIACMEALATATLQQIYGGRAYPNMSAFSELHYLLTQAGLSQVERGERQSLRRAWADMLRDTFREPNVHHVVDGHLVVSGDTLWHEEKQSRAKPILPSSTDSDVVAVRSASIEDVVRSLPYSYSLEFERRLSTEEWQMLRARRYENPRWAMEVRGDTLWIWRAHRNAVFRIAIRELSDHLLAGPIQAFWETEISDPIQLRDDANDLLDSALEQGVYYFRSVLFAVVGDVHGHMDLMVQTLRDQERQLGRSLDFVLQVGDFMPIRDAHDLVCVHAPKRYRQVGDFPKYYRGESKFPWPIYFIGGNHEPYGYLQQLESQRSGAESMQIADNVHYLGRVGAVRAFGVNVLGVSGIFGESRHELERPPEANHENARAFAYFNSNDFADAWSTYLDEFDGWTAGLDILLLHDWPAAMIPAADLVAMDQKYEHLRWTPKFGQPRGLFKSERAGSAARETPPRFRADAVARPRVAWRETYPF